ncbi:hypothetical protein GCM10020256_72240 [Streptomyces thermocoprophilus]
MPEEPRGDESLTSQEVPDLVTSFAGVPHDVTGARLAAERFLRDLTQVTPPRATECYHDILLIVAELAANAVQYAPGPFELRMRRTFDGVHVTVHDTSTNRPVPRPFSPSGGGGGHRLVPDRDAVHTGQRDPRGRRQGRPCLPAVVSVRVHAPAVRG